MLNKSKNFVGFDYIGIYSVKGRGRVDARKLSLERWAITLNSNGNRPKRSDAKAVLNILSTWCLKSTSVRTEILP